MCWVVTFWRSRRAKVQAGVASASAIYPEVSHRENTHAARLRAVQPLTLGCNRSATPAMRSAPRERGMRSRRCDVLPFAIDVPTPFVQQESRNLASSPCFRRRRVDMCRRAFGDFCSAAEGAASTGSSAVVNRQQWHCPHLYCLGGVGVCARVGAHARPADASEGGCCRRRRGALIFTPRGRRPLLLASQFPRSAESRPRGTPSPPRVAAARACSVAAPSGLRRSEASQWCAGGGNANSLGCFERELSVPPGDAAD